MHALGLSADEECLGVGEFDVQVRLVVEPWELAFEDVGLLGFVNVEAWGEGSTAVGVVGSAGSLVEETEDVRVLS